MTVSGLRMRFLKRGGWSERAGACAHQLPFGRRLVRSLRMYKQSDGISPVALHLLARVERRVDATRRCLAELIALRSRAGIEMLRAAQMPLFYADTSPRFHSTDLTRMLPVGAWEMASERTTEVAVV